MAKINVTLGKSETGEDGWKSRGMTLVTSVQFDFMTFTHQ